MINEGNLIEKVVIVDSDKKEQELEKGLIIGLNEEHISVNIFNLSKSELGSIAAALYVVFERELSE